MIIYVGQNFEKAFLVWFLYRLQVIIEFLHVLTILGKKSRHLWIISELIEVFGSKMTIYLSRRWFTSWRRWHGVMVSQTLPLWLCPLTDELWLTFSLDDLSHSEAKPWTWTVVTCMLAWLRLLLSEIFIIYAEDVFSVSFTIMPGTSQRSRTRRATAFLWDTSFLIRHSQDIMLFGMYTRI